MATLREQLMDELMEVGQEDLANTIGSLESDVEAANYIAANKGYFAKKYTSDDLQAMPVFRKAMYDELKTGKVDYDKEFGEGWYNNFNDIPVDQIKYVAEKQGVDWKDLVNKMSTEATQRIRHDIAYGEDQGGWLESPLRNLGGAAMHIFAPRQQEAIERGEDPSASDVVLDAAQNALYAVPYGSAMKVVSNPAVRTIVGGALSNAGAPFATEALDYVVYDDPNNPRSNFELKDALAGTGVNLVGGALLRGAGMGIGRIAPKVRDFLGELATGNTAKEAARELKKQYAANVNIANNPAVPAVERAKAQSMVKMMESDPELYNAVAGNKPYVFDVAEQEGSTLADKATAYIKKNKLDANTVITPTETEQFVPVKDKFVNRTSKYSPVSASLLKAYDKLNLGATEGLKTAKQLAGEEAFKNYITNEFGNIQDEQGRALTRVPIIGSALQKALEERKVKEAEHEENMRILDELRARGLLHSER